MNEYTITDVFDFADEIRSSPMNEEDILVSYDVTALFTNVPLSETIDILVNKAFTNDWFNQTYDLNLEKEELTQLLEVATTNQLFQFDGQLYEQTDGVAMAHLLARSWPMCLCATSRTNSHATVWYPLFTRGMSTTLLPECLTPMLLLTFWLH